MLVTADWVLPVAGHPIRDGGVLVAGAHIEAVGDAESLRRANPGEAVHAYAGCTIVPGLVNAHTHVSLTALEGVLPSAPFPQWVRLLASVLRRLTPDDVAASAALGAIRALGSGVTVVGDVAYGPEAPAACADLGVAGTFFWEVFGITESQLAERLAEVEYPADGRGCGPRIQCGISAHSMYTSGPGLLRAVSGVARRSDRPMMLHVAESPAEMRLAVLGDGPLEPIARRFAARFRSPRTSPVTYLGRLGVLDGILAVHCVQLAHGDAERLAAQARGVALCPSSNAYLEAGSPPVAQLREAGVRLAVGTDSPASAPGTDVLAEARALAKLDRDLLPQRLLRMLTADGAEVLGLSERFGTLEPGKQADLVAFRVGTTDEPASALVSHGSPAGVEAVMTAGVWRVLGGHPAFGVDEIERAAGAVTEKAASVLRELEAGGSPLPAGLKTRRIKS